MPLSEASFVAADRRREILDVPLTGEVEENEVDSVWRKELLAVEERFPEREDGVRARCAFLSHGGDRAGLLGVGGNRDAQDDRNDGESEIAQGALLDVAGYSNEGACHKPNIAARKGTGGTSMPR